jgi:hypothetical protein
MRIMKNNSLKEDVSLDYFIQREVASCTPMTRISQMMVWQRYICGTLKARAQTWKQRVLHHYLS